MEIIINNQSITVDQLIDHVNNVSYSKTNNPNYIKFFMNGGVKKEIFLSETTVNGVQMTPYNIDELLSPIFNSTGGSGGGISLPIDIKDVDGLQKILDDISESITLEDAVSAARLDTFKLWNSSILVLDSLINQKYGTMRANPFILASYKTTLDTEANKIQSSFTYLKNKMTIILTEISEAEAKAVAADDDTKPINYYKITDTDYDYIKTNYTTIVQSLKTYQKKEYEIEQYILINQSANPSAISGTLISGDKVNVYPWMYTARLIKNTTDNFMTLSLLSRNQTRKTVFSIYRNGVLTKQEIDITANFTTLFSDLGKDGYDIISISGFDKMGLRSFTIDLTISYNTDVSDPNIYALSCKYFNV